MKVIGFEGISSMVSKTDTLMLFWDGMPDPCPKACSPRVQVPVPFETLVRLWMETKRLGEPDDPIALIVKGTWSDSYCELGDANHCCTPGAAQARGSAKCCPRSPLVIPPDRAISRLGVIASHFTRRLERQNTGHSAMARLDVEIYAEKNIRG
jgi:hypothetical protein